MHLWTYRWESMTPIGCVSRSCDRSRRCLLCCWGGCLFVCLVQATRQPAALICFDRSIAFRSYHGGGGGGGGRLCFPPLDPGAWHPRPQRRLLCPPPGSIQRIAHRIPICLSLSVWNRIGVLEARLVFFFQAGAPTLEQRMAAVAIDGTPVHQRIAAADSSIRKGLDCQTFIVSPFTKGREIERERERERVFMHTRRGQTLSKIKRCDAWIDRQSMRLFHPSFLEEKESKRGGADWAMSVV